MSLAASAIVGAAMVRAYWLAVLPFAARILAHEHVAGPPTGRCIGCGASIERTTT